MTPAPRLLRLASFGLVVAALPLLVDPRVWMVWALAWALLIMLLVIDAFSLRSAVPTIAVALPRTIGVGEPTVAKLALRSTLGRRVVLTLRSETEGVLREGADLRLELRREADAALELLAPDRGRGQLAAIWIRAEGRLGLLRVIRRQAVAADIRVIPSLPAIRRLAVLPQIGGAQVGPTAAREHGGGTEFAELQVYASGMDTRAIDWKASARHLELRVRRFRAEQNQRVIVVLDTGRSMRERVGPLSRLDHAIHIGLALAQVALRGGDQVGLHAYGLRPHAWVRPGAGMAQLRKLVKSAAEFDTDERESNPVHGLRDLISRLNRRSLIVLLSNVSDPTATELLTEALTGLARRHLVVLVTLADPGTHEPMAEQPDNLEHITRAVLRDDIARDRKFALDRMRHGGVHVLSAEPTTAALLVLRRYFHVKQRGRL
jgi:uncharacterized protein (DUF58 family)